MRTLMDVHRFLELEPRSFDPAQLRVRPHESDSHYRQKYPHRTHASIRAPAVHAIPARIQGEIERNFAWYYTHFYPDRGTA